MYVKLLIEVCTSLIAITKRASGNPEKNTPTACDLIEAENDLHPSWPGSRARHI